MEYWRPLKITNLSAEDLKDVQLVFKMKVYVAVSVIGDPFIDPKEEYLRTSADSEGETNPSWDTHLNFIFHEPSLQNNNLTIIFHFHCDRPLGDGHVGEVRVPVKDLFHRKTYPNGSQLIYYPVTRPPGRKQGSVKFSFTFGDVFASMDPPRTFSRRPLHIQSPTTVPVWKM